MGILEFFYLVAGLLVGFAATAGYGVLSLTPGHYRIARRAFWLASTLFASIGMVWGITAPESLSVRMIAVGIIGAISLVGLTESLRWIRTIESPAGGKPVKSTVPLLKLEASVRDIHVKWADASLFPETEDRKSPWVLRLKKLAGSKAVKIELAFHISENLDRLRDNLKASLFSALVQRENGDWSIPLQFVRKDATHTVFVGFHGENVRRIDSLDDKDGSVSVAYPAAIQNILWLHALQAGFEGGKRNDEHLKGPPAKSRLELENFLMNASRNTTIAFPDVTVDISYAGLDGKTYQQKETIRSIFLAISTPKWVYEDTRKEKIFFEGGFGDVGFEDKENPDDGFFAIAKRQGFIPAN